jgi:hypothetical protein
MNKCQRCGAFVPVEKAFCPNCSEPMEPEEAPNRADTFSSEMMSTIRDDPEGYRDLLAQLKNNPPAAEEGKATPDPAPVAPPVTGYNFPGVAPGIAPPAKSNKPYLVLAISGALLLIIVFVILFALKLI